MNSRSSSYKDPICVSDGIICAVLEALSDRNRVSCFVSDTNLSSALLLRNSLLADSRRLDNITFDIVYNNASRELTKLQPHFELLVMVLMYDLYHRQTPIIPIDMHETLLECCRHDDADQDISRLTSARLNQSNGIIFGKMVAFINLYPSQTAALGPYLFQRKSSNQLDSMFLSKCLKKKTGAKQKSILKLLAGTVSNLYQPNNTFLHLCNLSQSSEKSVSKRRELIRICKYIKFNRNENLSQTPAIESIYKILKIKIRHDAALQIQRNWRMFRVRSARSRSRNLLNGTGLQSMESERRHLHDVLKTFETKFEMENGRKVTSLTDIQPVMAEYKRYKEIKKAIKRVQS